MIHNCIDWDAIPLRFLTISYGDKRVVTQKGPTSKVREFKSLQSFAHRKFCLQDHPLSSLRFRTTCNLSFAPCEDDSAFEVDKEAWEEEGLVDLVCCLEVYLEEVMPGPLSGEEASQPVEEGHENARVHQQVRDSDERQGGEGEYSGIAEANDNVVEDEARDEDEMEREQDKEEQEKEEEGREENEQTEESEESNVRTRPYRRRRRVIASDDEDSPKAVDRNPRLAADLQQTQNAAVIGDTQPSAPSAKDPAIAIHLQDMSHVPEWPIKKEKETSPAHVRVSSVAGSSQEGRAPLGTRKPLGQPVKQEQQLAGRLESQPQATQVTQQPPDPTHNKLVISIQHKPSAQHAQFSAKPHTRIGKVLAGACKSFRLDVNVAQLYLVVITQNDKGLKEEDYFLCDRNETVETAIVGVEGRADFIIRMPEDPAM
ncbi:uncharacterized protein EDB93DRAFT_1119872 [Suillus bovinus]|uniref:uncharacterized protein n=1 Tax=Suillus bovinus TaxID=48563 RepID=UPI001B88720A|nr:uncharacterized protein EDB93DRAFT_1119872 [Suillus bovinus]KAG2158696.1 hypothetical protein EDB93DRAFT_1119872 [Suillus bovinus]